MLPRHQPNTPSSPPRWPPVRDPFRIDNIERGDLTPKTPTPALYKYKRQADTLTFEGAAWSTPWTCTLQ